MIHWKYFLSKHYISRTTANAHWLGFVKVMAPYLFCAAWSWSSSDAWSFWAVKKKKKRQSWNCWRIYLPQKMLTLLITDPSYLMKSREQRGKGGRGGEEGWLWLPISRWSVKKKRTSHGWDVTNTVSAIFKWKRSTLWRLTLLLYADDTWGSGQGVRGQIEEVCVCVRCPSAVEAGSGESSSRKTQATGGSRGLLPCKSV